MMVFTTTLVFIALVNLINNGKNSALLQIKQAIKESWNKRSTSAKGETNKISLHLCSFFVSPSSLTSPSLFFLVLISCFDTLWKDLNHCLKKQDKLNQTLLLPFMKVDSTGMLIIFSFPGWLMRIIMAWWNDVMMSRVNFGKSLNAMT